MRKTSAAVARLSQSERAGQSAAPGPGVVRMHQGDPDFATPRHILEALNDALEAGYTHYAPFQGDPELRAVVAEGLARQTGETWTAEDVAITHGGTGAVYGAMVAYLDPGDQVLIPEPNYSLYGDVALGIGAEATFVPSTENHHLDLDALAAMAGPRAKMVILCNPCNPTGAVLHRDELEDLARFCVERDILVLADEAYDHILYDGREHVSALSLPGLLDRVLYCQTFSKTFAMTGLRLGYLAARGGMANAGLIAHKTAAGQINSSVQRAGLAALTTQADDAATMLAEYAARRELLDKILASAEGIAWRKPEGTFYAFVKYDADMPAREFTQFLLERGLAVRSGSEFGPSGEGYVRLSFATSRDQIEEGAKRLASAAAEASRSSPAVRS